MAIFTVSGYGKFPIDMLRFDECWPIGVDDAALIADTQIDWVGKWTVALSSASAPTPTRWQSFMCTVIATK